MPTLSAEQEAKALEIAVRGDGHEDVANALRISLFEFWMYRGSNPAFEQRYQEARREGVHTMADQLRTLAASGMDQAMVTNQSRNVQWLASKLDPKTFGDKVQHDHTHTVDLLGSIEKARVRAEAALGATQVLPAIAAGAVDAEWERVPESRAPDLESDADEEPPIGEGDVFR